MARIATPTLVALLGVGLLAAGCGAGLVGYGRAVDGCPAPGESREVYLAASTRLLSTGLGTAAVGLVVLVGAVAARRRAGAASR